MDQEALSLLLFNKTETGQVYRLSFTTDKQEINRKNTSSTDNKSLNVGNLLEKKSNLNEQSNIKIAIT